MRSSDTIFSSPLSQEDVDLFFQIEHGYHEAIAVDVAGRFVVQGYLRPLKDCNAAHSVTAAELEGRRIYLGLTAAGRTFLAAVRDGLYDRHAWKPS